MISRRLVYQNSSEVTLAINQIADVIDPRINEFYESQYNDPNSYLKACIVTGSYESEIAGMAYMEETWRYVPVMNKNVFLGNISGQSDLSYRFDAPVTGYVYGTNPIVYTSGGAVKFRFKVIDINGIVHYSDYKYVYVDYDGNIYNVLEYGTQLWTVEDFRGIIGFNDRFHYLLDYTEVYCDRGNTTPMLHKRCYSIPWLCYNAGFNLETEISTAQQYHIANFDFYIPSHNEMETFISYLEYNSLYPCDIAGKYSVWENSNVEYSPGYNYNDNNSILFDIYPFASVNETTYLDDFERAGSISSILLTDYKFITREDVTYKFWNSFEIQSGMSVYRSQFDILGFMTNAVNRAGAGAGVHLWGAIRLVSDIW